MGFETCCFGDGNTELFHRAIPCTDFLNRCAIQGPENEPMHFDPGVSFRSIYPRYVYIYMCTLYWCKQQGVQVFSVLEEHNGFGPCTRTHAT